MTSPPGGTQPPLLNSEPYRILSLDGGGAKGFYSLGALKELEAMLGRRLCQCFDLIFGTSTGAIIAALLALGYRVYEIHTLYKKHVPAIMRKRNRRVKSAALKHLAENVFEKRTFADVKAGIGIVATRCFDTTGDKHSTGVMALTGRRCEHLIELLATRHYLRSAW